MSSNSNVKTVVRATKSVNTIKAPVAAKPSGSSVVQQRSTVSKPKPTASALPAKSSVTATKPAKRPLEQDSKEKKVAKKPKSAVDDDEDITDDKIAGDNLDVSEERSMDEDDGSDLKDFIMDEEDESDGVSDEEEAKKIEKDSIQSVDDYRKQMDEIKAMFASRQRRDQLAKKQ